MTENWQKRLKFAIFDSLKIDRFFTNFQLNLGIDLGFVHIEQKEQSL